MSEQNITARILSVIKAIEVRQVLSGLSTQVRDRPSVVSRGLREIERLEVAKPSVVNRDNIAIRRVLGEQTILKVSNVGPQGGRGEMGPQGPAGPAGDIDNFLMDDLSTIFRGRL